MPYPETDQRHLARLVDNQCGHFAHSQREQISSSNFATTTRHDDVQKINRELICCGNICFSANLSERWVSQNSSLFFKDAPKFEARQGGGKPLPGIWQSTILSGQSSPWKIFETFRQRTFCGELRISGTGGFVNGILLHVDASGSVYWRISTLFYDNQ